MYFTCPVSGSKTRGFFIILLHLPKTTMAFLKINIHISNKTAVELCRNPINKEASTMRRKNQLVNQKRRQLVEEAVILESSVGGSFYPRQGFLA